MVLDDTVSFVAPKLIMPIIRTDVDLSRDFTWWNRPRGAYEPARRRFFRPHFPEGGSSAIPTELGRQSDRLCSSLEATWW